MPGGVPPRAARRPFALTVTTNDGAAARTRQPRLRAARRVSAWRAAAADAVVAGRRWQRDARRRT